MENLFQFRKLGRTKARGWLFLMVLVAFTHLLFQSFLLPYGKALRSMLPDNEVSRYAKYNVSTVHSSTKSVMVRNPLTVNASDLIDISTSVELENDADSFDKGGELGFETEEKGNDRFKEVSVTLENKVFVSQHVLDRFVGNSFPSKNSGDVNGISTLVSIQNEESDAIMDKASKDRPGFPLKQIREPDLAENISLSLKKSDGGLDTPFQPSTLASSAAASMNTTYLTTSTSSKSSSLAPVSEQSDLVISKNHSAIASIPGRKKMRCEMPPKSITSFQEMNHILARHRAKSHSMRPRWSSIRDHEILALKPQIEHAPPAINDRELYAPLFRNISMFKRKVKFTLSALFNAGSQFHTILDSMSYELMERTLKVYVYKEGGKPIFHQPILKGLYASEGWFMKLMEGNRRFVVKDPRRAHLFYMPFSSRMLEYTLYVRNSHNRTNLRQYLKEYTDKIATKYPYFNRTGGADHFLVACHDWAPYETRHHMERCMKALCNADVTAGFKIGRDVSLPETYIRSARNPLRDLGGKPPSQRHILAFYAGNMHGYLRPILLKYWKGKDHDMKIFGPMPPGVASKMSYIQHMKSSKFCICPKGYEVNSPRVVEAIFYECVPVIISDNFVPPYFEVLNWEAFSVVLAEKDIPRLKDILLAIPKEKYLEMQLAVRKVQKHFLWHAKPMKYDLFHMTLHSIWYNRVFQIKPR